MTKWQFAREKYDKDGYVIAKSVLDADLVAEGREHVEWLMAKNPGLRPEALGHTLMSNDAFWVRLVSDDRLLDIAEAFIGPNIALFASHYIAKQPFDGQPVLWHQDGSYWPLEPMEVVTLWVSFDDSTRDNGCLRVLPGTQHTALQKMHRRTEVANVLSSAIADEFVDESAAVDVVLAPGDVSIHHPNVIHGSDANTSPRWRRGLTIRYIPASTEILHDGPDPWPSAFLLRGNAVPGINVYRPWPKYSPETSIRFKGCENWPPND
jgi:ectoine hydroxylase-related dioxygenase (phytanoyl-CoA dioxygenase family)